MPRPKTTCTRSELAGLLKLSKGRITQLITKGLPVRSDGRLNIAECRAWYQNNVVPPLTKTGPKPKTAAPVIAEPETVQGDDSDASAHRELLDAMITASEVLPEVLLEMGVRNMGAVHGASDLFAGLLLRLAGPLADAAYGDFTNDDIPAVRPDYVQLAARFGIEYDAVEADKQAGTLLDWLYGILDQIEKRKETDENAI